MQLPLLNRKSRSEQLLETVTKLPSQIKAVIPDVASSKAAKAGLITAGGLAGLTAGGAGLSSLRRHREEASDDS
jgi:hypothetical protein